MTVEISPNISQITCAYFCHKNGALCAISMMHRGIYEMDGNLEKPNTIIGNPLVENM